MRAFKLHVLHPCGYWAAKLPEVKRFELGLPIGTSIYEDPQSQPQSLRFFEVEDRHLKNFEFFFRLRVA